MIRYSCKIKKKIKFLDRLSKNTQISNLMKVRPVAPRVVPCGRADRRDMTKLIVAFRNYTKAPKKEMVCGSNINMKERKDPASIKAKNNKIPNTMLAGRRKKKIH